MLVRFAMMAAALLCAATGSRTAEAATKTGYAYSGVQSRVQVSGISAVVTALARPQVRRGHVSAWVGVGDPRRDAWLQIGINGIEGGSTAIYVESKRGADYRYRELRGQVAVGERHRVAVIARRNGTWEATLDGKTVAIVALAAAAGTAAQAIAETWTPTSVCNSFAYKVETIRTLRNGSWRSPSTTDVLSEIPIRLSPRGDAYEVRDGCGE
jgi:hypothetical protein